MKGSISQISQVTSNANSDKDETSLWFNTKIPLVFEEFYGFITGDKEYMTPRYMESGSASEVHGFSNALNQEENKE